MLSKKVKEYKRIRQESDILYKKSQVLISNLRKSLKKNFQDNLKKEINKAAKIRFSEFDFGTKKSNKDAARINILSVNDAEVLDNCWRDEHGHDASKIVPFSVEWLEDFCREQSEILGINIQILKFNS